MGFNSIYLFPFLAFCRKSSFSAIKKIYIQYKELVSDKKIARSGTDREYSQISVGKIKRMRTFKMRAITRLRLQELLMTAEKFIEGKENTCYHLAG
jgi:hypothetical protein